MFVTPLVTLKAHMLIALVRDMGFRATEVAVLLGPLIRALSLHMPELATPTALKCHINLRPKIARKLLGRFDRSLVV